MITPEIIEEVKNRLVNVYQPETIYLFGSYAWGHPEEESDLDLLVVVRTFDKKNHRRTIPGRQALFDLSISKDLLVYTQEEFDAQVSDPTTLLYKIKNNGKVIYTRQNLQSNCFSSQLQNVTYSVRFKTWIDKASCNLKSAKILIKNDDETLEGAAYAAQQSAEKAFSAYLIFKQQMPPRIDDLTELLIECSKYDPTFEQLRKSTEALSPYIRDGFFTIDRKEALEAITHAEKILSFVKPKFENIVD